MSVCTSIELVEHLAGGDLLKVFIDNITEAYWLYDYAESLKYVNQEVNVDYRTDIYKGNECRFINTFIAPSIVQTLDKDDHIKLFCDQEDNQSTVSFNDMELGETKQACVVFCIHSEYKSSASAVWQEFIIRDRFMRVAKLRVFDYANTGVTLSGRYIMTELSKSKYGFQSTLVTPVDGLAAINPEITIAEKFIMNYFANDSAAVKFMSDSNVLHFIKEDIDYETGYGLVRLAMELSIVDSMSDVTRDVDLVSIGEALLASRGYLTRSSILSNTVNNVLVASGTQWPDKKKVLMLLDLEQDDEELPERKVMCSVVDTVATLLEVRKGVKL